MSCTPPKFTIGQQGSSIWNLESLNEEFEPAPEPETPESHPVADVYLRFEAESAANAPVAEA
jgi:hypothetical protein